MSDHAREVWAPRFRRVAQAWSQIEWLSVAARHRPCAAIAMADDDVVRYRPLWAALDLGFVTLPDAAIGLGDPAQLERLRDAWSRDEHDAIGALLGYPPCCRDFFVSTRVRNYTDTTWPMAGGGDGNGATVVDVSGDPNANVLLRCLRVNVVLHLPCAFDCAATTALGRNLVDLAESVGRRHEAALIREVLSWPMEWSALHGIAEIRTPILKIVTNTDAFDRKFVVRRAGTSYPDEGANGLSFPYRTRAVPVGRAAAFSRGLANPVPGPIGE